jgi:hypothetical protein
MGGGLLQLVAQGAQDAYLSGNPQITFWKGLFKRHTNFAMEPFRINLTGMPTWGQKQSATLGRHADLIYSTYLEVSLKAGMYNNDQRRLGYNLLRYIELEIGGQLIDRLYGEWLFLWDSLSSDVTKGLKLHDMVADGITDSAAVITEPASCSSNTGRPSKPTTLYVPLPFFYTRNPGAALPMIALQYHEVKINVLWNSAQLVAGNFNQLNFAPNPSSAAIYVDYIYLDVDERRRMAQESHEYLIEQVQYNEDKGITSASQRIDLTFNHPVKELVWVVQPTAYTNCKLTGSRPPTVYPVNSPIVYNAATGVSITAGTIAGVSVLPAGTAATGSLVLTPTYTLSTVYGLLVGDTVTVAGTTMSAAVDAALENEGTIGGSAGSASAGAFNTNTEVIATINYSTKEVTMNPKTYTFGRASAGTAVGYATPITFNAMTSSSTLTPNDAATDRNRLTPFTYNVDAVFSQHLQFNGQDRLDKRFGDYYNKVQPFQHHTGSTASVYNNGSGGAISTAQPGVYCYSFCLKPEEQQPSGTCNFSRIDTATIVMSIDGAVSIDDDANEYDVRVYATNYNILRIMSGMAGLAYSN